LSVIESERTPQSDKGHILRQTARTEFPKRRYDGVFWMMIILYIPLTIGPLMLAFGHVLPFTLLICGVTTLAMGFYNKLESQKRDATKGNFYIDNRGSTGRMEIVEQIEVKSLTCVVRPGRPYPYHKVRVQKEEYESALSKVGTDVKIYDADEIQGMIEAGIEEDVERRIRARLAEPPTFMRWLKSVGHRMLVRLRLRKREAIVPSQIPTRPLFATPYFVEDVDDGVAGAEGDLSWEIEEKPEVSKPMEAEEAERLKKRKTHREYMRERRAREKAE